MTPALAAQALAEHPEDPNGAAAAPSARGGRLQALIDLAKEPSSARRRELLREVTDLFFAAPTGREAPAAALFDSVLSALADEMEAEVRAELARRFADAADAPAALVQRLAQDDIAVAEPILRRSPALTPETLETLVRTHGQDHLRAVSQRADLTAAMSDAIVERGDDATLKVLLSNEEAPLSREASEQAVDRAAQNPDLHEAVVGRANLPIDLLNEMYEVVETRLRHRIMERNEALDPEALNAALAAGRKRLATRDGALPPDYTAAEAIVRQLREGGAITPKVLVGLVRQERRTAFLVALAQMTEIDFHTARRIVDAREIDGLAVLCKAARFDRTLFLTLLMLVLEPSQGMRYAQEYGRLYAELPQDSAMRTMRFWRLRRETQSLNA